VGGQSAAFHPIPGIVIDDALVSINSTSLDITVGNAASTASGSSTTSISSQIAALRSLFNSAKNLSLGDYDEFLQPFLDVLDKKIALVVFVNQVDEINSVLRLKKEFGFDLVINGGAEAHRIADKLALENVSVILNPARQPPNSFESWNSNDQSALILTRAGVKVGLSVTLNDAVRTLRWEAGMVVAEGLAFEDVLPMVTKNIAEMYKINNSVGSIQIGTQSNFVVFSADPLSLKSDVLLVAVGNYVACTPPEFK